jgi:hypothetical protein
MGEGDMSVDSDPFLNTPYPKLPLGRTIGLSYSTYFQYFIDALRVSWLWLIVVAVVTGFASWSQWSWMSMAMAGMRPGVPPRMPQPLATAALMHLDYVLLTLAGVSIAVAWHRLLILGEHPVLSGSNVATRYVWRYIGVGLMIGLIVILPIVAIVFPTFYFAFSAQHAAAGPPRPAFALLFLMILILYVAATAVMLRLTLLLPARAVGDMNLTFRETWRRTRGNTWRLFWGILATTMPPIVLAEIAFVVIGAPHFAMKADPDFVERMTATSTIFMVYYLLMVPIGIGFLSHAYRHFFRQESGPALRTSEA